MLRQTLGFYEFSLVVESQLYFRMEILLSVSHLRINMTHALESLKEGR